MNDDDDDDLLRRLRAGERAACSVFVRRHAPGLRRYFRANVGGDVEALVLAVFGALMQISPRGDGTSVRASLLALAQMILHRHLTADTDAPNEKT